MPGGGGQGFSQLTIARQTVTGGEMGSHPHHECHEMPPPVVFIGEKDWEDVQWEPAVRHPCG